MSRSRLINNFHSKLLEHNPDGDGFLVSGWSSGESQKQRFDALIRTSRFRGGSVIDYGCGPGDLFQYLIKYGLDFDYTGMDQNHAMISLARERHKGVFKSIKLDEMDFQKVDYIFCSGIFQFIDIDNTNYYLNILKELFERCNICLSFNILSAIRDESNKNLTELYVCPSSILDFCTSLTRLWVIDHSYHLGFGDMTIALHKESNLAEWHRPSF